LRRTKGRARVPVGLALASVVNSSGQHRDLYTADHREVLDGCGSSVESEIEKVRKGFLAALS
jgi:hypothetical protein